MARSVVGSVPSRINPPPKQTDPFYLSSEWRRFLSVIIRKRGKRCEDCGKTNCRIYGDHITERKDGGADFDEANIRLRCGACHNKKTAHEKKMRAARE